MDIDGRTFALLLIGKTQEGEDDWAVLPGTGRCEATGVYRFQLGLYRKA